jgi:predicted NAD-dependent protein-ADP-ribosyltransferase YbiA (DUF1768 family)
MTNEGESFLYFNSNAKKPMNELSNLNAAEITIGADDLTSELLDVNPELKNWLLPGQEWIFASIEHLWHALKAVDRETFMEFTNLGRFGKLDAAFFEQLYPGKGEQKRSFWAKKQNVGIVPKLASNPKHAKKLGLNGKMKYEREFNEDRVQKAVWHKLLTKKYASNSAHRRVLMETRARKLIELARGAAKEGSTEFWGGYMRDGKLLGRNFMGDALERVRDSLQSDPK